jgi:hypothetical protein
MQLVQGLLHSASMAIFLCGLPNTSELHYASLDSLYAGYQTPPVLLPLMKALWLGDTIVERCGANRVASTLDNILDTLCIKLMGR